MTGPSCHGGQRGHGWAHVHGAGLVTSVLPVTVVGCLSMTTTVEMAEL